MRGKKTQGSQLSKYVTFQVADVHKPLLSTARAADAGYDSYYGKDGGYLKHRDTGDTIPIYRRENLYFVRMWLRHDKTNVEEQYKVNTGEGEAGAGSHQGFQWQGK